MSKQSISLLFIFVYCLFISTLSHPITFTPATPCPTEPVMCTMDLRPYCVKYIDGTIKQEFGGGSCPPCGENIEGIFRGKCEEKDHLSYLKYQGNK